MEFVKIILTSLLSVVALFIIAKIMGHRQIAQLDFYDYITGITFGSIAAELATELEEPWKPLVAMIIYGGISILLTLVTRKLPRSRKYINGSPTILMNNGKICRENFIKSKIDLSEFMIMCRERGFFDLSDIQTAVFEHNGKLTILPKSYARPLTPQDVNISTDADSIGVEVIMDGRIMGENLRRMGLDDIWLSKELKKSGYKNADEIFLAICYKDNEISFYPK